MSKVATLQTLDTATPSKVARVLEITAAIFGALGEGLAARDRYETQRARGIPHAIAAAEAFYVQKPVR